MTLFSPSLQPNPRWLSLDSRVLYLLYLSSAP